MKYHVFATALGCLAALSMNAGKSVTFEYQNARYIVYDPQATSADIVAPLTDVDEMVIPSAVEYEGNSYYVKTVAENAFAHSPKLTSVVLPENLKNIMSGAFASCYKLTDINLDYVTGIAPQAFANCSLLGPDLKITKNKVDIAPEAFINCISLKSVQIGEPGCYGCEFYDIDYATESYAENGFGLFKRCWSLESVDIYGFLSWENGYSNKVSEEFYYSILPSQTFALCSNLKHVNIPELERIMNRAFWGCTSLTEFTMPASMKLIESEAFIECDNMRTIFFEGDVPPRVRGNDPFDLDKSQCTLVVPDEAVETYRSDEYWGEWPVIITRSAWNAGVSDTQADTALLKVIARDGELVIDAPDDVCVFDCSGRRIVGFTGGDKHRLCVPAGVYIVTCGAQRVKVAL